MPLASDFRYAFRVLRANPAFACIAIATLAFAIGVNSAIFSVFDGILLRPLGYTDENRLVAIHEVVPKFSQLSPRLPVNAMHFLEVVTEGFLNLTTVYDKDEARGAYPAVHSRHLGLFGQPLVTQYQGFCEAQD